MATTPATRRRSSCEEVHKSFGSVQALRGVDFEVRDGEVMALVGDNGAGKSTLIKCVAGIYSIDCGEILFDGQAGLDPAGRRTRRSSGSRSSTRTSRSATTSTSSRTCTSAGRSDDALYRLREAPMEQKTTETLASLSVTTIRSVRQPVATLSGGQRQSVAVARAVMWNNRVVFLDEPTAALGVAQTRQVLDLVKRLGEQGLAVVLVSHNLTDVFEVADRITVLRLGRNVGVYEKSATTPQEIVEAITSGAPAGRGVGVSTAAPPEVRPPPQRTETASPTIARARWDAFKGGDVGSVPVIVGIIAITIFFTAKTNIFFTAVNFSNLIGQMAGVTVIAVGIVFVLLIGEIDLSVGYVSGIGSVVVAEFQMAGSSHDYPGLVAIGHRDPRRRRDRRGAGLDHRLPRRALLRGHARRPADRPGDDHLPARHAGRDRDPGPPDPRRRELRPDARTPAGSSRSSSPRSSRAGSFGTYFSRRRAGLPTGNLLLTVGRVVFYGGLDVRCGRGLQPLARRAAGRADRPLRGRRSSRTSPRRTTFGRHVYAVGGNAEAARRAGINVKLIRILCFVISGACAGLGGVILASRLNSVDLTFGGGTLLLDAISAAVIGGVSLFGGRGRVSGALFGGLIIGMISNGTDLVGSADWVKYVTTGTILLAAVTLDTVARRRQVAAGR